jgi:hypothetical protein
MQKPNHSRLFGRLALYYITLIIALLLIAEYVPGASTLLPVGGHQIHLADVLATDAATDAASSAAAPSRVQMAIGLAARLVGTLVLMLPVTWVYMAVNRLSHSQAFIAALMVSPICVTSIVLLIQDSLPLAFGLAALVAAVRFQIPLRDALDGVFVFAAICVGLSSGVGYVGIALVMSLFFCFTSLAIHASGYGAPQPSRSEMNVTELRPGRDDSTSLRPQN